MANGFQGPPAVDFYGMLSGLGDTIKAQRVTDARKEAFSSFTALDPNSPDYGKQAIGVAQRLGAAGDQDGALKFLTVAQTAADRAHTAQREGVTDQHWNQSFELQKRAAARADDPTPANFIRDASVPGGYRPIGPADPAYLAQVEAEKAKAKADVPTIIGAGSSVIIPSKASEGAVFTNKPTVDSSLDDETTDLLARRSLQGDTRALVGLGRGAQGSENILKIQRRVAEIAKAEGKDASDILSNVAVQAGRMSEARSLGTKSANFGVAEKAMEESLPIAFEASRNVPRTAFPVLNQLILTGKTNVGDPNVKKFLIATDTAAKDYARTINPSGTTRESDIAYARKILSMADGPETYAAALDQLKTEAGVTKRAIQRQKEEVKTQGRSEAGHADEPASFTDRYKAAFGNPNAAQVTSTGVKWSIQ